MWSLKTVLNLLLVAIMKIEWIKLKAKGLGFDIAFHLDLYEWAFPAKRPGPKNDFNNPEFLSIDQDVNLHYVGIT